jgi:hypothetical protein
MNTKLGNLERQGFLVPTMQIPRKGNVSECPIATSSTSHQSNR